MEQTSKDQWMNFQEYSGLTNRIDNNGNCGDHSKPGGKNRNVPLPQGLACSWTLPVQKVKRQTHHSNFIFLYKLSSSSKLEGEGGGGVYPLSYVLYVNHQMKSITILFPPESQQLCSFHKPGSQAHESGFCLRLPWRYSAALISDDFELFIFLFFGNGIIMKIQILLRPTLR